MEKYRVKIRGIRPLLMNRFPVEEYLKEDSKPNKVGKPVDPMEEAKKALYVNSKGEICTPATHILGAMIRAASDYRIPGKGKKTFKDAVKSGVIIEPEMIPHKNQKWELDIRPVVVNRARIPRARPRFDEWELEFTVTVLDERITPAILKEILTSAGRYRGIGDFRPQFGLFEVVEFEKIS